MLTKGQKDDVAACYEKGLTEAEALNFIMTKYCRCELPAYDPRGTVYNYIVRFYNEQKTKQHGTIK